MATGTTLGLALGIPLVFIFIVCVIKQCAQVSAFAAALPADLWQACN